MADGIIMEEQEFGPTGNYEYTGHFTYDYTSRCMQENCEPFNIYRPIVQSAPRVSSGGIKNASTVNVNSSEVQGAPHNPKGSGFIANSRRSSILNSGHEVGTHIRKIANIAPERAGPLMWYSSLYGGDEDKEPGWVHINNWHVDNEMGKIIMDCLANCNTITHLTLNHCGLDVFLITIIANIIGRTNIVYLSLDNNPLPNDSENIYGSLISEESSIRLLSLRGNDIGDSGAATIAEGLKTNHSLVSLNLWGNKIGTNGVKALADALKINSNVQSFSLASNKIDDLTLSYITKIFAKHPLTPLEVAMKKKHIADVISNNKSSKWNLAGDARPESSRKSMGDLKKDGKKVGQSLLKKGAATQASSLISNKLEKAAPAPVKAVLNTKKETSPAKPAVKAAVSTNAKGPKKAGGKAEEEKEDSSAEQAGNASTAGTFADFGYEVEGQFYSFGNTVLKNLNLSWNRITDVGASFLHQTLLENAENIRMSKLSLQGNEISEEVDGLIKTFLISQNADQAKITVEEKEA